MSIKPIDFQVMVPKTNEISKTIQDNQQKNLGMQFAHKEAVQEKAENDMKKVHTQDKASGVQIREKQEKGNKKEENKKNKNRNDKENQSIIDIKL